jgi:hypothetical protein
LPVPCPPFDWIEAGSTAYWCCGGGWFSAPLGLLSGTLNWTVSIEPTQWPAERKQWLQSSIIHAVQTTGISRPTRGSLLGTRSSVAPHWLSWAPGSVPTSSERSRSRLGPLRGWATTSTKTVSPLK